jgi:hypothetical protein
LRLCQRAKGHGRKSIDTGEEDDDDACNCRLKFLQVSSWVAGNFLSTDSENLSVQNISLISFIFVLPFGQYCEPPSRTKFKQQFIPNNL